MLQRLSEVGGPLWFECTYRCKVERIDIFTALNQDFHSYLFWWYTFIGDWNGLSILRNANTDAPADFCIETDASGSLGVVLDGIITGFSGRGLKSKNQWE